jgi:hypothetical protein
LEGHLSAGEEMNGRQTETMKTKSLFIVTALIEVGIGVALLVSPALVVPVLIGEPFNAAADSVVGRVAGAALLALGLACWRARDDDDDRFGRAARGLLSAVLLYNVAAAGVLAYAGGVLRLFGIGLWPAVALHTVMAVWCFVSLRSGRPTTHDEPASTQ